MASRQEPPISEALMALFAGAAPLIERAKAAGLFRTPPVDVTPTTATPTATGDAAKMAALQDIVVAQAQKIVALEAEIAKLKA